MRKKKVKVFARSERRSTRACFTAKKKRLTRKFYKSSVDNKSYFHKSEIFLMTNRQKIEEKLFNWLQSSRCGKNEVKVPKVRNFCYFEQF